MAANHANNRTLRCQMSFNVSNKKTPLFLHILVTES